TRRPAAMAGWVHGARDRWFRRLVEAEQGFDLVVHRRAQAQVQRSQTLEIPGESGDGVGDLEQLLRQLVAGRLVSGQGLVRSPLDGARQELRVAQGVADAASG